MFVLLAVVVAVVVVAIIAIFTRSAPTLYAEDTPEGVVQRYSQAVIDGEIGEAESYLVPDVVDDCFRMVTETGDRQVILVDTNESGDTATVEVRIVTTYGSGPFGANQYETESRFELDRDGGRWLIAVSPWELAVCENGAK